MAKRRQTPAAGTATDAAAANNQSDYRRHPLLKLALAVALAAFAWSAWPLLVTKWQTFRLCHLGAEHRRSDSGFRLASLDSILKRAKPYAAHSPSSNPSIVVMDNFLSAKEVERLAALSATPGFSAALTGRQSMRSSARTSDVSFCNTTECRDDPVHLAIRRRASELTGLPEANQEEMQFVRYEAGQLYSCHHDQQTPPSAPQGPRVWTLLMYLSEPGGGGATRFNDLGFAVEAIRGRAVLFPNVWTSGHRPGEFLPELLTHHEAETVTSSPPKLAANLWIHARSYRKELGAHCAGAHDPDILAHQWRQARREVGADDSLPPSMRNATLMASRRAALQEQGIDTNAISQSFFFVAMGVLVARIAGLL